MQKGIRIVIKLVISFILIIAYGVTSEIMLGRDQESGVFKIIVGILLFMVWRYKPSPKK